MSAADLATERIHVSVVIATYNRGESVAVLLEQLAAQTLSPARYEVIVVDDGSSPPVAAHLSTLQVPYRLQLLTQRNAGPATARHRAITEASGELIVVVDDDMRVAPTFLADHVASHPRGGRRVVLGRLRPVPGEPLPLFERCHLALLQRLETDVDAGRVRLRGTYLYTGNVSFRRGDYFAVGGFDRSYRLSEDSELGVRMDLAGVELRFADGAPSQHASDHTSLATWMRRSMSYGVADSIIAYKHPNVAWADPWRFLFLMHPIARLPLLATALAPRAMRPLAWLAMFVSLALARVGAERVAVAGTTFVYGLQYFAGVGMHAGSARRGLSSLMQYVRRHARARDSRARNALASGS